MQRPRNPRHFPRMKIRGASRRRQAPWQRMLRGIDGIGRSALEASGAFERLFLSAPVAGGRRNGKASPARRGSTPTLVVIDEIRASEVSRVHAD